MIPTIVKAWINSVDFKVISKVEKEKNILNRSTWEIRRSMEKISCFLTLNHTQLSQPYIKSIDFFRDEGENKQHMLIFVSGCSTPLRRYLRYFRRTHWQSSLSRRLFAFYTLMNRVTEWLYGVQCRSHGVGEWLKGLFYSHGQSCPPSSVIMRLFMRNSVSTAPLCCRVRLSCKHVNSARTLVLPNMKYAVRSHPFSMWENV